ncbi:NAD+ synthase [Halomicrobium zhouii]|uniref:NH(3)-dependent NAD(+) synthetase n=1 Tax=Halomicrobium zhouii TaxID=767519 RepID=A0A1I6K744_9EURY|nr:NAD(+) synthase [Halomicrobium zhouii]SFR87065.1 NAD+ synthase [Halomicrobium zhouii]
MSDATTHPRILELPREETGLATSKPAVRRVQQLLPAFLEDGVAEAGADGLVVRLDGSVETAVAAALAVDAVGADRVTGLVMPAQLNDEAPARDAEAVASILDVDYRRLALQPLLTAFQRVVGTAGEPADDLVAVGNASERFRMACTYYVANTTNRLVVGTVTRTERLLGSVTKYGETGVDLSLFGDLYRTEIRALAREMDLPEVILDGTRRRTGNVDPTDAEKLGVEQTTLDGLLHFSIDEQRADAAVAERVDVDESVVRRARRWCARTRHKRHQPPKPSMAN